MYKEFALLGLVFLLMYLLLRWLFRKNRVLLLKLLVGSFLITIMINIIYNLKYIFPEYVYGGVPIGDCRGNLFTYKDDSEFQWQILFPMLKNRTVYVDDSDDFYHRFFELYSDETKQLTVEDSTKKQVIRMNQESPADISLSMVELLNYAIVPRDCALFDYRYPALRIQRNGLEDSRELVAIIDEKSNLYLITKEYYDALQQEVE